MNPETLKGHLEMLLLAALQDGAAHGYAIADTLRTRSGGHMRGFSVTTAIVMPTTHANAETRVATSASVR